MKQLIDIILEQPYIGLAMGRTADDRLTARADAATLKQSFGTAHTSALADEAQSLALSDNMPFDDALRVVSGQTRRPYGASPGRKVLRAS